MLHKYSSKLAFFLTAFLLFFAVAYSASAHFHEGIEPKGFVNDFAHILPVEVLSALEQKLSGFAAQTSIEISVVTLPDLGGDTIENYAVKLFEEWGIGDEEKDNGALLLVALEEREVRIEVGYGLEGVLTDAQSNGIIQKIIIPSFRSGDMAGGIVNGADAMMSVAGSEADYSGTVEQNGSSDWSQLIYVAWFFIIMLGSILARSKSWWLGGVLGGVGGVVIGFIFGFIFTGIVSIAVLTILGLIFDYLVSKGGGGKGGSWPIFFGGGHGGSGGGFGGFGGGMSGGGGASGRW